jgi:hypothetical protein
MSYREHQEISPVWLLVRLIALLAHYAAMLKTCKLSDPCSRSDTEGLGTQPAYFMGHQLGSGWSLRQTWFRMKSR